MRYLKKSTWLCSTLHDKQLQAENGFLVATEECDKMPDGTDAYHMYYTDGEKIFHAPSKINLFGWRIFTGTL